MQWTLWLLFLMPAQYTSNTPTTIKNITIAVLAIILSLFCFMDSNYRKAIFLQDRENIKKTEGFDQAINHIKSSEYSLLAGCGYSSYPRHIEYRLATSQNFSDCLDLIEDHIVQKNQHYEWQSPLAFTLVLSLQSIGFDPATSRVSAACKNNIQYRNSDVYIFQCNFEDLKTLDLDALMPEIQAAHQWYKTRLR